MKTYMIITNPKNEDYILIKKYIEKNKKINSWFAMWKFVIFTSDMDIKEVQDDFTKSFDGMLFFVSEIKPKNICGSMPSDLWDFIIKTNEHNDKTEDIENKQTLENKTAYALNNKNIIAANFKKELYNKDQHIMMLTMELQRCHKENKIYQEKLQLHKEMTEEFLKRQPK